MVGQDKGATAIEEKNESACHVPGTAKDSALQIQEGKLEVHSCGLELLDP